MKRVSKILFKTGISIGCAMGIYKYCVSKNRKLEQSKEMENRFRMYYNLLASLYDLKDKKKTLEEYFIKRGYKTIAIYGMGSLGKIFYDEIKNSSNIEVKYIIDLNFRNIKSEIELVGLEKDLPKVDIIVVTPISDFYEIESMLVNINPYENKVVSLEDVIEDVKKDI